MSANIVIFDGVCRFCSGTVDFVIARDPARKFKFAPMQSESARTLIEQHYRGCTESPNVDLETFLLIKDDRCLVRSDAALAIAGELAWPWPLLTGLRVVPRKLRDYAYDRFAASRYRLFGKRTTCRMPDASIRDRFLD